MTVKKNERSRDKRAAKRSVLKLGLAAAMVIATTGAIVTIASSPIISTSVSRPALHTTSGLQLTVNPAFYAAERAQSEKASRILAGISGQSRAARMNADDIRLSYLKPQVEKAGSDALVDRQRNLVASQIAEDDMSVLANVPDELIPGRQKPAASAPAKAMAALEPQTSAKDSAESPFSLVLQGVDDGRLSAGEVPLPAKRPAGMALAYASFGQEEYSDIFSEVPKHTAKVAVYDISAGKVYMPDGEVMEAHSGKGKYRDNPKYTHLKMAGAVPAATYKLTPRESLFHGVPALRMTSVDGTNPLGRTGLLAHTYMLRTPGDSHGCLVFKDYYKFLKAYKANKVDYIVAVPNLDKGLSAQLASR